VIEVELPRLQASREATRSWAQTFTWDRCVGGYIDLYAGALPAELGALAADSARTPVATNAR